MKSQLKALVLFSGGQDSTTALAMARDNFYEVETLSFDYGQRHSVELKAARQVMACLFEPATMPSSSTVDLRSAFKLLGGPLIKGSRASILPFGSAAEAADAVKDGKDPAFLPGRNMIFLSFAFAHAESIGADRIILGANAADLDGFPDCTPNFLGRMEQAGNSALGKPDDSRRRININSPLLYYSKREICEAIPRHPGLEQAIAWSHTCYRGHEIPCGTCHSCIERADGFHQARQADPLIRRLRSEGKLMDDTLNDYGQPSKEQ